MGNFGELIRTNNNHGMTWPAPQSNNLGNFSSSAPLGVDPERIRKPRVIIASAVLDTSGSMEHFIDHEGKRQDGQRAVIDCHQRMKSELIRGESERHAVILGTWGFQGMIHPYHLPHEVPDLNTSTYVPQGGTPLLDTMDECFAFADSKQRQIQERNIRCSKAFMILSDGLERDSTRATPGSVRQHIAEILSERGNFIFGIGLGKEGCQQLAQLGIPEEMLRDVSRGIGLGALFREFTTMATQGGAVRPSPGSLRKKW